MFKYIPFLFLLIVCSSCQRHQCATVNTDNIQKLVVSPDDCLPSFDMSTLLSDSVSIIPLETNDRCLIANIKKIDLTDDYIFISDKITQKVLMFGMNGNFICCIGQNGDAPNEYGQLGCFEIIGDSIFIQDIASRKYIVYDYIKHQYMHPIHYPYHHTDITLVGDLLYEVGDYLKSEEGYYLIFGQNLRTGKTDLLLPFSSEINKNDNYWGIYNQVCKNGNQPALAYFPLNDTIFQIDKNGIMAKYLISFTKRTIPEIQKNTAKDLLGLGHKNGYILYPMYIQQSDKFFIESFVEGIEYRYLVMDKSDNKFFTSKQLRFERFGGLALMGKSFCMDDNHFIMYYNSESLLMNGDACMRRCKDFPNKHQLEQVMSSINEESNPVIFKMRFK